VILAGKRLLITGVITKDSIGFHVAEQAQREGAEVLSGPPSACPSPSTCLSST
jgi:enoyl-[acyl-carrier-protein] reductase (NADH)